MRRPHMVQKSTAGTLLFWAGHLLNIWLALDTASKATVLAGKALRVPPGWTLAFAVSGVVLVGGSMFWLLNRIRAWPLRYHRKGWRLTEQERFEEAIAEYERSYRWFSRHRWLDHLRAPLLLDPSGISNRESALLNIAYCHDQMGEPAAAETAYRRVLEAFPHSRAAPVSLYWRKQIRGEAPPVSDPPDESPLVAVQCSRKASTGLGILLGIPAGISLVNAVDAPSHRLALAAAWGLVILFYVAAHALLLGPFHRGMKHLRSGRYAEAEAAFAAQDRLLARHPWVDRFRALLLLSASAMTLRELAQTNMGLCRVRMGDREGAEARYRQVLEAYPDNPMARDALRMLRAAAEEWR